MILSSYHKHYWTWDGTTLTDDTGTVEVTTSSIAITNATDTDSYNMISFKAGDTGTYRAYMEWLDHTDTRRALLGWNRENSFIAYNDNFNYHPIFLSDSGSSSINAYGVQPLNINRDENATSTGGLRVYNGAAAVTAVPYGEIVSSGIIAWGTRFLRAYNGDNTKYISINQDDNYGYITTTQDMYLNTTTGGDIWFVNNFTLKSRFNVSSNLYGINIISPTTTLHIKGSGATSATNSLRVQNSADTVLFNVRDDGNVGIGTTSPGS